MAISSRPAGTMSPLPLSPTTRFGGDVGSARGPRSQFGFIVHGHALRDLPRHPIGSTGSTCSGVVVTARALFPRLAHLVVLPCNSPPCPHLLRVRLLHVPRLVRRLLVLPPAPWRCHLSGTARRVGRVAHRFPSVIGIAGASSLRYRAILMSSMTPVASSTTLPFESMNSAFRSALGQRRASFILRREWAPSLLTVAALVYGSPFPTSFWNRPGTHLRGTFHLAARCRLCLTLPQDRRHLRVHCAAADD